MNDHGSYEGDYLLRFVIYVLEIFSSTIKKSRVFAGFFLIRFEDVASTTVFG
jgi:hypothetical protein